ncbi:hypothetical protein [Symbiobacterium thermophilum]|nr:hypothetical protein [Symbiobacterium thermophilum]
MRSLLAVIAVAVGIFLLVTVVLPFVGILLAAVLALAGLGVVAYLAAPVLARLPWFRDRIHVEEHPLGRTIRFGAVRVHQRAHARRADDFIDVEGRTIDVEEDLLPPGDGRD